MIEAITMLGLPLLMCLALMAIVGYMGLHVLKREVIFIDITLAQFAAVGAIIPHVVWGVHEDSMLAYVCPFICITGIAAFFALARRKILQIPLEAIIGVSYAIAAGAALFILGKAPGGHVHVKHMLMGSILWTTWSDIFQCALVFSVAGFVFYLVREPLRRISDDYDAAAREGMRVALWDFLFYTLFGVVIIMAVRIVGVVVVFCFLIIPATTSAIFSSKWGTRLILTWMFGALASVMGLLFAYCLDFSLGSSVAAFAGLILIISGIFFRRERPKLIVGAAVVFIAAFCLLVITTAPRSRVVASEPSTKLGNKIPDVIPALAQTSKKLSSKEVSKLTAQTKEASELKRLFSNAPGPESRSEIVCRAFDLDTRTGAELLLQFLKSNPPLFFRATVLEKLNAAINEPINFDVAQDFSAPANQKAAAELIKRFGLNKNAKHK